MRLNSILFYCSLFYFQEDIAFGKNAFEINVYYIRIAANANIPKDDEFNSFVGIVESNLIYYLDEYGFIRLGNIFSIEQLS